jgi:NADPH-dependent glutamate synthase beta subunit-like oxidoreductase
MRYGIPAYRLRARGADARSRASWRSASTCAAEALDAQGLQQLRGTHDAVYLATGAARSKRLPQLPARRPG